MRALHGAHPSGHPAEAMRGLAEVLANVGQDRQARAHAATALSLYEELNMARWIDTTREIVHAAGPREGSG